MSCFSGRSRRDQHVRVGGGGPAPSALAQPGQKLVAAEPVKPSVLLAHHDGAGADVDMVQAQDGDVGGGQRVHTGQQDDQPVVGAAGAGPAAWPG